MPTSFAPKQTFLCVILLNKNSIHCFLQFDFNWICIDLFIRFSGFFCSILPVNLMLSEMFSFCSLMFFVCKFYRRYYFKNNDARSEQRSYDLIEKQRLEYWILYTWHWRHRIPLNCILFMLWTEPKYSKWFIHTIL